MIHRYWITRENAICDHLSLIFESICNQNFRSQAPSKNTTSAKVAYSIQLPISKTLAIRSQGESKTTFAMHCVKIPNNSLTSSWKGDYHKGPMLLATYPMAASPQSSNDHCCVASPNITMHLLPLYEEDCSKFQRTFHQSVNIDSMSSLYFVSFSLIKIAAPRKVKEKGLVHSAISIGTNHTISSLPQLSNPSPSVGEGEKSGQKLNLKTSD